MRSKCWGKFGTRKHNGLGKSASLYRERFLLCYKGLEKNPLSPGFDADFLGHNVFSSYGTTKVVALIYKIWLFPEPEGLIPFPEMLRRHRLIDRISAKIVVIFITYA
jgi:hypothetical protein